MAASGFTPILLYGSGTATNVPLAANLTSNSSGAELAINYADGKLFYKDSGGVVQVLATKGAAQNSISFGTTGLTPSTATQGAVTVAGTLVVGNGGTGQSSLATGAIGYGQGTSAHAALAIGSAGQVLTVNSGATAPQWTSASSIVGGAAGSNTQIQFNNAGALGASSAFTFDGVTIVSPSHTANTATTGSTNKGPFNYGTLSFSDTGIVQSAQTSVNSYFQNVMQNTSAGASASAEFIAYNDQGTASTNYATVGINSSGYSGTGSINAAGYGYFLSASTDLVLGTIGANGIHFTTNSSASDALAISSTGVISIPSSGTANGVAYLNASKQLTTGSALTFDGSKLLVSSSGEQLKLLSSGDFTTTGTGYIRWYDSGGSKGYIGYAGTANQFDLQTGSGMNLNLNATGGITTFAVSNAEQMRLTSTGLGIGTSSPSVKLDAVGGSAYDGNFYLTAQFRNIAGAAEKGVLLGYNNANSSSIIAPAYASGSGALAFWTQNGSAWGERMRLDSAGNLGLGVTPSAWVTLKAIEITGGGSISSYNQSTQLNANCFYNGSSYAIRNAGSAAAYLQIAANQFQFYQTSVTSGTFNATQAMTLDASGNLVIGATSASAKLHVAASGSDPVLFANSGGGSYNSAIWQNNNSYKMAVGIGGGSVGGNLQDTGYIGTISNIPVVFQTNNTERARIDTSGSLIVAPSGTGNGGARLKVFGANSSICASFDANSSTLPSVEIICSANNTTQQGLYVYSTSNSLTNAIIYSNGNIVNRNNSYGAISDVKLKENIVDTTPKLADLMQVKVRNYTLVGTGTKQIGVVAQELEAVFPSMVDESPDLDAEGNDLGTTTKSVKYSVFVPMLIKGLQEQQAIIESLTTRLSALESK